ncbi:MAG: ACP phosphodiesterase [Luteolibacter sp.]
MNFLAHLYLAAPTDESLVGNLLGDFVKGWPGSLEGMYPRGVIAGIRQHRAIDVFTDGHPLFREARGLLSPERRRLAGIVVDVFYDFFLSEKWPGGEVERRAFIKKFHGVLQARDEWLSPNFRAVLPRMISEEWLESYSTVEGMALTFRRVSARAPAAARVLGAEEDFLRNEDRLREVFEGFFPDLEAFSERWLEEDAGSGLRSGDGL